MVLFRNVFKVSLISQRFRAYSQNAGVYTMKVLNVAEKNDAAKHIAGHLSGGNPFKREGRSKYNKIYEFNYQLFDQNVRMVMTSVSGHVLNYEFIGNYSKWTGCSPEALFDAPVVKHCPENSRLVKENLEKEARTCDALVVWTDCDREGENIGFEVISICTKVKPGIRVYRAKFSEITRQSVKRAVENLERPNENLNAAVEVRSELDLRIGAAFTRFQTLRLQKVFPEVLANCLISYGSCQFPTLGFVVERYKAVQNFIPETFWKLKVTHKIEDLTVEFNWQRVRLFDKQFCEILYERCRENLIAKVENISTKTKYKYRPVPLDTIELEKIASRKLKLSAKETMRLAERLYTQGFISYPRTETNIFPNNMNLRGLVEMQQNDARWGGFVQKVLNAGARPRQGKKSDQAHPPIHPTKYTNALTGNEARLYEYIVRHFLACVSDNAVGLETIVTIDINDEKFLANGLIIQERNYLEVYPYEKWNAKEIHNYENIKTFEPTSFDMVEGQTSAPNLLTEADLISLMEKNGIGTDATHAEHIETIKQRMYVGIQDRIYFVPGELGIGLVEGYDSMGFEMSKPHLRAELEADLKKIGEGTKDPKQVLASQIQKYREVFVKSVEQANKLDSALNKYLQTQANHVDNNFDSIVGELPKQVMKCPKCGLQMVLKHRPESTSFVSCNGFPQCRNAIWLPSKVQKVEITENSCTQCGPEVKLLKFHFRPGSMAPYYPNVHVGCVAGCDQQLLELLEIRSPRQAGGDAPTGGAANPPVQRQQPQQPRNNYQSFNSHNDTGYSSGGSNTQFSSNRARPSNNIASGGSNTQFSSNRARPSNNMDTRPIGVDPMTFLTFDDDVHCNCNEAARKLTVMKESVNKGREFYVCPRAQTDPGRCNFFQWANAPPAGNNPQNQNFGRQNQGGGNNWPSGSNYQRNNGPGGSGYQRNDGNQPRNSFRGRKQNFNSANAGTAGPRKCGICRQPGHTRKNCPNNQED